MLMVSTITVVLPPFVSFALSSSLASPPVAVAVAVGGVGVVGVGTLVSYR